MIDLAEVRVLAVARCFDVLEFGEAAFGAAEVLAGRFDPISVLRFLEAIETRRNRPLRPASGSPIPIPPNRKPNSDDMQSALGANAQINRLKSQSQ
jgi:hypothetical protein